MIPWLVVGLLVLLTAALAYGIHRLDKEQDELNKIRLQREELARMQRAEQQKAHDKARRDKSAAAKNAALDEDVN